MSNTSNEESQSQSYYSKQIRGESQVIQKQNQQKGNITLKKKRIVRKKYKARKKDIFIHTICIMNKTNFKPQNSIIENFMISGNQLYIQNSTKNIHGIIQKKDNQYLKKLMDNIKFSQNLSLKMLTQNSETQQVFSGNNSLIHRLLNLQSQANLKWYQGAHNPYSQPPLPQHLNLLGNHNMFG